MILTNYHWFIQQYLPFNIVNPSLNLSSDFFQKLYILHAFKIKAHGIWHNVMCALLSLIESTHIQVSRAKNCTLGLS